MGTHERISGHERGFVWWTERETVVRLRIYMQMRLFRRLESLTNVSNSGSGNSV